MNSRKIIAEAWDFTQKNKRLMWWYAFLPALLTTLIGIFYLAYQFFSFKRVFEKADHPFIIEVITKIAGFLNRYDGLWIPTIVSIVIILLLYALLPTLCQGGLIQLIAKHRKGEPMHVRSGIGLGMLVFLPLLEYHLLIKTFSIISLFTEAALVIRTLGVGALKTLLPIFILILVIGFILTLLFTYSEFFIVLDKKNVLKSMGASAKLVVMSWQHTFIIGILMLIIGLRVIINIIAVLLVPALLFFSAGLIATVTLTKIGIIIGIAISFLGLLFASYVTGILNVFANAVWTFTFLDLKKEKDIAEVLIAQK